MAEEEKYWPWLWKVPEGGLIGKPGVRRKDGYEKASGRAVYTRDVSRPGMLYAKTLESPYAHAKIKSMDTSKAEAYPGVKAVIRWDDPELVWANIQGNFGARSEPTTDTAHWAGQPIGAILCADSEAIVDEALKLIEIEWEELSFEVDWDKALEPGAPILRPDLNPDNNIFSGPSSILAGANEYGDIEAGFAEATNTIDFTVKKDEDVWAGVEPHSCVAEWKGDYLDVWARTQGANMVHTALAGGSSMLFTATTIKNVRYAPLANIHVHAPYVGAQFGGLNWFGYTAAFPVLAVLCAKRTQRPVKMLHDGSHFYGAGENSGTYHFKIGFKDDGKVTALKIISHWCGCTIGKSYEGTSIANQKLEKVDPYLSRGPTVCYKHGGPSTIVLQMLWNHVAAELGMDPTEVAEINDGCAGEDMEHVNEHVKVPQGFDPTRDSLKECHAVGKAAIDWDNNYHAPGTRILPNGNYHGIGYTSLIQWAHTSGQNTAGLKMRGDGTVNILARHNDGGWNSESTWALAVATESGLKYEDIVYRPFDDPGFEGAQGGGSSGMNRSLPGMVGAARKLKGLLLGFAVEPSPPSMFGPGRPPLFPDKTPEELDIKDSVIFEKAKPENKAKVADVAAGFESALFVWDYPPATTPPVTMEVMARQCYFMEVEVDPDTGKCHVKRVVVVNDVGRVMSPETCIGQGYGGTYMGIGRSNTEEVYYDPQTGVKLNDNLIGYPIAVVNDCSGEIDCHLVETGLGYGAYGSYGDSEAQGATVQWLTGSAIYNAIGKWVDFPTTPDKVLKAWGKI